MISRFAQKQCKTLGTFSLTDFLSENSLATDHQDSDKATLRKSNLMTVYLERDWEFKNIELWIEENLSWW